MRRALVALAFGALAAVSAPALAAAQTSPSISLSLDAATIGQPVTVSGQGFPATTSVSVQLCGDQAARGSTDCDVVAGQTVVTNETGAFQSQVVVRYPPVPCPCVVWATSNGAETANATAPIGVVTAAFSNPPPAAAPSTPAPTGLEVVRATVRPVSEWRSWLGLPSSDELVVTLRNPTQAAVVNPVVALTVGKGSDPARVIPSPDIDRIEAGAERTVMVPFQVDALTWGRLTVKGTVGSAQPVVFRSHVTVTPWLLVLVLVALIVVPFVVRSRRRRRAAKPDALVGMEAALGLPHDPDARDAPAEPVLVAPPEPTPVTVPEPAVASEPIPAPAPIPEPEPVPIEPPEPPIPEPEPIALALDGCGPRVVVTFTWPMWLRAKSVSVCGEFNDWSTDAHPLARLDNGDWGVPIELEGGRAYRYKFFVDGERWENDWVPDELVPNEFGSDDSLVVVGFEDRYANVAEQQIPRSNGNGHHPELEADDVVDLAALDQLAPPNEDFWAEEPKGLRVKLRRRHR